MNQGKVIRFCLVALPTGLLLMGAASVMVTHVIGGKDADQEEAEQKRQQAARIMRKEVNREDLERYVRVLSEDIGERNLDTYKSLRAAAFWIESSMGPSNMGYAVDRQNYEVEGQAVWNVVAELKGLQRPDEIIVVGAHYDTVPGCPGANDNGTGVAALLSLANAFSGSQPSRTILFVAFVNEEPPHFQTEAMGSVVFADWLEKKGARVKGMVSLETIGYYTDEPGSQSLPEGVPRDQFPEVGNFVAMVGNPASKDLVDLAAAAYEETGAPVPALPVTLPESVDGVGWSDHWAFWQVGYPAFMVTDTAPFRYAHYHEPTDTPDKIDFERYTEVVKGMQGVIEALANP